MAGNLSMKNEDVRTTLHKFRFVKKEHQYDNFLEKHNEK